MGYLGRCPFHLPGLYSEIIKYFDLQFDSKTSWDLFEHLRPNL